MLIVLHLHVNPDHRTNINGQPVFSTVYARDPGFWLANFAGVAAAIVVAAIELGARSLHGSNRPGLVAMVLGGLLCAYSLFGLLYGIAAIAPIGAMIILSGTGIARQPAPPGDHAQLGAPES